MFRALLNGGFDGGFHAGIHSINKILLGNAEPDALEISTQLRGEIFCWMSQGGWSPWDHVQR